MVIIFIRVRYRTLGAYAMFRASPKAVVPDMTAMTAAACLVERALVPPGGGIETPGPLGTQKPLAAP